MEDVNDSKNDDEADDFKAPVFAVDSFHIYHCLYPPCHWRHVANGAGAGVGDWGSGIVERKSDWSFVGKNNFDCFAEKGKRQIYDFK